MRSTQNILEFFSKSVILQFSPSALVFNFDSFFFVTSMCLLNLIDFEVLDTLFNALMTSKIFSSFILSSSFILKLVYLVLDSSCPSEFFIYDCRFIRTSISFCRLCQSSSNVYWHTSICSGLFVALIKSSLSLNTCKFLDSSGPHRSFCDLFFQFVFHFI